MSSLPRVVFVVAEFCTLVIWKHCFAFGQETALVIGPYEAKGRRFVSMRVAGVLAYVWPDNSGERGMVQV